MRRVLWALVLGFIWLTPALASTGDRRVALVIGNGAYRHTIDLPNAPADARAVAAALRRLGFVVIEGIDLTNAEMQVRLKTFSREMEGADVGLFYYAGHGMQVAGENYLIPIDANPKRERDLDFETLKLDLVMKQLLREAKIKIVILDSCRDNPLAAELSRSMAQQGGGRSRSVSVQSGMGIVDTHGTSGTLVAFATAPGTVALDGRGQHSPFTEALLQHMETPGIDIDVMMKRVRGQVTRGTSERQVPWTNSSLTGEFHLAAARGGAGPQQPVAGAGQGPAAVSSESDGSSRSGQPAGSAAPGGDKVAAAAVPVGPQRARDASITGRKIVVPVAVEAHPASGNGPGRGWVGINIEGVSPAWARAVGLDGPRGAFVTNVQPQGPASRSELRFGDIVLRAGDRDIVEHAEIASRVQSMAPGTTVLLEVWRIWEPGGDFLHVVTRLAEAGNVEAMARLGVWYATGTGVGRSDTESARWLKAAAEHGNGTAMLGIAQMQISGRGVAKDMTSGMQWLQKAASAGQAAAMHNLGLAYFKGEGVAKNVGEAIRWLRKAADAKFAPAMFDLGVIYSEGTAVQKDMPAAIQWYRSAAEQGNAAAMANLGLMHSTGAGLPKDEAAAARWFRQGAEGGNAMAMNNLAYCLDRGLGVGRDADEAAHWMLQAIDQQLRFSFEQMAKNSGAWTPEFRRSLQRRLKEAGFYTGSLDGEIGQGTLSALASYATRAR